MKEFVNRTTLPPMLSQDEEVELLNKLYSNKEDLKVRNRLIEGNYRLLLAVVDKYKNENDDNIEDLLNLGIIGMIKAVNTFETTKKIRLSDYMSKCIENEFIEYKKSWKREQHN